MDYADMNNPTVWGWDGELQFHSMHDSETCAVLRSISQKQSAGLVPYDDRWATDADGAGSGAGTEPGTPGETPVPPSGTPGESADRSVWTTLLYGPNDYHNGDTVRTKRIHPITIIDPENFKTNIQ